MDEETGDRSEEAPAEIAGAERIKTPVSYFHNANYYFESSVLFVRHDALLNRLTVAITYDFAFKVLPEPHTEVKFFIFDGVEDLIRANVLYRDGFQGFKKTDIDLPVPHLGSEIINAISAATNRNSFFGGIAMGSWGMYQFRFQSVAVRSRYFAPLNKTRHGEKLYRDLDTNEVQSFDAFIADEYQT